MPEMPTMKEKYVKEVAPALMEKFQYKSSMQIPRIDKIVVSVGCGDCKDNNKALDAVIKDISNITGQKAVATIAKVLVGCICLKVSTARTAASCRRPGRRGPGRDAGPARSRPPSGRTAAGR